MMFTVNLYNIRIILLLLRHRILHALHEIENRHNLNLNSFTWYYSSLVLHYYRY